MKLVSGELRISASDLSDFLACRHLTRQSQRVAAGVLERPSVEDAGFDQLAKRGRDHEAEVLRRFESQGWNLVKLAPLEQGIESAKAETHRAMSEGVDGVYQAVLQSGSELGLPDFLIRADLLGSDRGGYEVVDAKLARSAKARAVLQTTFYSRLLSRFQADEPYRLHLALGAADDLLSFKVSDFAAYERQVAKMLREFLGTEEDPYPDPVEHCAICKWRLACSARRRIDDDLSLVAGISARERKVLKEHGVATLESYAELDRLPLIEGVKPETFASSHAQARIQLKSRRSGKPEWEFREPERDDKGEFVPNRGLLALPLPNPGDLFFDIEGARFYSEDNKTFGLQYLFGIVDLSDLDETTGQPRYHQIWSLNRTKEKSGFEELIDFFTGRLRTNPGLHIYHYNHYEPTTVDALSAVHGTMQEVVGELMGRLGTREVESDSLFQGYVFVDLYRVVKQSIRVGVESYSIKRLEELISYRRQVELKDVNERMVMFEAALEDGTAQDDEETLEIIRGYNEDDCRATMYLRNWLEARRPELAAHLGLGVERLPRPVPPQQEEEDKDPETAQLYRDLMSLVPQDPEAVRSPQQSATELVANLLEWHRREDKPAWWMYFYLRGLSDEDMLDTEGVLFGLEEVKTLASRRTLRDVRFRFPAQDHPFKESSKEAHNPHSDIESAFKTLKVFDLDDEDGEITITVPIEGSPPRALVPNPVVPATAQKARIRDLARSVVALGEAEWPRSPAFDLLLRRSPNLWPLQPMRRAGEEEAQAAARLGSALTDSCLPIQGPPGSGKTYAAALMILDLVQSGKTVGITGPSHSVIDNLMQKVSDLAGELGRSCPRLGQRVDEERDVIFNRASNRGLTFKSSQAALDAMAADEIDVLGGTSWLWASESARQIVSVLIVDESGQMSLANTLAIAAACNSFVLLGDPMQLAQPSQAAHPDGAGASALEHVLGEHATMPEDLGIFIGHTRRMHPDLTAFTSEVFYDGKLKSIDGLEKQRVFGKGELIGSGLRAMAVEHDGNSNSSPEEAQIVSRVVGELLGELWEDPDGRQRKIMAEDVLIVTPFNAQIQEIRKALEQEGYGDVMVGTVDKFQGREAPVTIYSLASSSVELAPRGMEFLYQLNRLNVATSRARCISVIVANPNLVRVMCKTPHQMRLANALCRARERAIIR